MRLVFDTEGDGYRDAATRLWCVVAKDLDTEELHQFGPNEIHEAIALLDKADEIAGHNIIGYDLPILERIYGWKPKPEVRVTDTVIRSRLYKSDRYIPTGASNKSGTHSLGVWGYRLGRGKPDHEDWSQFSKEMMLRCTEDTEINYLLYWKLEEERGYTGAEWEDAEEIEHAIARYITQQEINGVPLDLEKVRSTLAECERELQAIESRVIPQLPEVPLSKSKQPKWPEKQFKKDGTPTQAATRYYGEPHEEYRTDIIVKTEPMNLNSPAQVKDYLLSIGWVPTEWNYKKHPDTGKPLRDALGNKIKTSPKLTLDSLESCTWPEGMEETGEAIVRHMVLAHRIGMLKGWLRDVRPDGRLSSEAVPMGTPTGRMTHRKVVNVPGKEAPFGEALRSCFTTVPGYTRVGIDLQSCQIYSLCHYMPDEGYRQAVRDGDPHVYVQELGGLDTRQKGKKLHYSTLFGAGPDRLASDLDMTKAKAEETIKRFFKNLPELDKLLAKLEAEWKENHGWIRGLDGRAIWVRAKHMLLNYLVQSMEAIVMKNFIVNLLTHADWQKLDYQLVTTMHDEVQILVRDDHVENFVHEAHQSIKYVNDKFKLEFPQEIDRQQY